MIGPELITNGDFETDINGWDLYGSNATWSNGKMIFDGGNFQTISQDIGVQNEHYYIIELDFSADSGILQIQLGDSTKMNYDHNIGHIQCFIKAEGTDNYLYFWPLNGIYNGSIDNVSVKECDVTDIEVDGNHIINGGFIGGTTSWTVGTGWAYGSNNVVHSSGNVSSLNQYVGSVVPSQYLVIMDISGTTSSNYIDIQIGNGISDYFKVSGTGKQTIIQAITGFNDGIFYIFPRSGFTGNITNVYVQKIGFSGLSQTNLNLKNGKNYKLSITTTENVFPELIINGSFDNGFEEWTHISPPVRDPITEWFYNNGNIICIGGTVAPYNWCAYAGYTETESGAYVYGVPIENNKKYRVSFDYTGTTGSIRWALYPLVLEGYITIPAGVGHYSGDFSSNLDSTEDPYWLYFEGINGFDGTFDNVSIKEINPGTLTIYEDSTQIGIISTLGTSTFNFTSIGGTTITILPSYNFLGIVNDVSLKKVIIPAVDDNIPIKEFLTGNTDEGREIFFRADTQQIQLMNNFETFSNPLSIVTRTQRGSMLKCFVALNDEDFYEIQGTATKGVSILKIHSKNKSKIPSPPIARKIRISWRDGSKQLCRLIQSAIIFIPGTMDYSE